MSPYWFFFPRHTTSPFSIVTQDSCHEVDTNASKNAEDEKLEEVQEDSLNRPLVEELLYYS